MTTMARRARMRELQRRAMERELRRAREAHGAMMASSPARTAARVLAILVGALALTITGCRFDPTAVSGDERRPVVHAILNPYTQVHAVIVEEAMSGTREPGRGQGIRGARVVIRTAGDSVVAREDAMARGTYRFVNSLATGTLPADAQGLPLLGVDLGRRYTLEISLPDGRAVRGETTVPMAPPVRSVVTRTFDPARDTLRLPLAASAGGTWSLVRVWRAPPASQMALFSEEREAVLPGTMRHPYDPRGDSRLFLPGARQTVEVAAVDAAFVEYFRAAMIPGTAPRDAGRLEGGLGVFGAYVPVLVMGIQVVE